MVLIAVALGVVLVVAGLITAYVAYPHRGQSIPHAEWLSDVMTQSERAINDKLDGLDERRLQHRGSQPHVPPESRLPH
jgi:hypothetical protein